jgi:ATP-dependent RNA helicase RhlB
LDLPEAVRRGIADAEFTHCTPIQASTLPLALAGRDVAGQAQTGTGKTAAFLIATFTRLLQNPIRPRTGITCPRALIVAPTRELVIQIREEADLLGKHCGFVMHAVYGGVDYAKQLDRLKLGVDILVGTPGRLIDYFKQRAYRLDECEILVIDEADRMFDMGFIDDIRYLVRRMPLPDRRQSFLYSATLSQRVLELAYEHMNRVERIAVSEDQVTAENVEQLVYHVGQHEKLPALLGLLAREQPQRGLIFVNTRSMAGRLGEYLEAEGYKAGALAGDIDQKKRLRLLEAFKNGDIHILVATDVASRGLHIEAVTHVFNYDLPQDPEDYVHRIGRTARAGASGKGFSLACEQYVYSLEAIEQFIGHSLPYEFPDETLLVRPRGVMRRSRGRDAQRGSRKDGGRSRTRGETQKPASTEKAVSEPSNVEAAAAPARKKRRRRRRKKSEEGVHPTAGD